MLRSTLLVIITIVLTGCSIGRLERLGVYQELDPKDYLAYVRDSSVNIIDVRTAAEYEKSHIRGAVNVNYFGGNFIEDLQTLNLDSTKTTLIYCETQHRSLFVAKKLYKEGFLNVIDLDKGMMNWRKLGFPYTAAPSN